MMVVAYTKARLEEELSGNGLTPLQNRALAMLVESNLTLPQIAAELGINRQRLWEIRKNPDFQAAYQQQMAILEADALRYAIASRVERIAALNAAWIQVRDELAKRKSPRVDLTYALVNLQQAAAKELGQDVQRLQIGGRLEIEQAVRVIRFEEQPVREVPVAKVVEGEFRDVERRGRYGPIPPVPELPPQPPEADQFARAVGITTNPGRLDPEHAARLKAVIAESGLDPVSILSPEQYAELYGAGKEHDPWTR